MKKIIYSIISDDTFGIKVKDDMKLNILRILDRTNGKVMCRFDNPIQLDGDKVQKLCLEFYCPEDESFIVRYRVEENVKFFRAAIAPTKDKPDIIEDYMVINYSNGLTEYKTRYKYHNSTNYSENEYYYNGEEITEEEASNLFNPKTK